MSEPVSVLVRLAAILVLVALNGLFVAAEFALVSIRRTHMAELEREGRPGAARVQRVLSDQDRYIAATQLGITMSSLGLGWLGGPAVAEALHGLLGGLPALLRAPLVSGVIAFLLISSLHLIVGELAPKSVALRRPERTALLVSLPLDLFLWAFGPAVTLLSRAGVACVRVLGLEPISGHEHVGLHSAEEIELLVEQSGRAGVLEDLERQMLRGVFDIGDHSARQAMTPRTRVQGLSVQLTLQEAVAAALSTRHSRLPVYENDLDHIGGVVHLRDLLQAVTGAPDSEPEPLRRLARPLPAVPEALTLDEVLGLLRAARAHMAVVVDEYGGTAGILTLEDILREIVGEVPDEFAIQGPAEIVLQPDGSWLLEGAIPLDEVDEQVGSRLTDAQFEDKVPLGVDTLAGLVVARLGRLAEVGDEVLEPGSPPLLLRVEEVEGRRITRIRLGRVESAASGEESGAVDA